MSESELAKPKTGGGFYVQINSLWTLRGIVSASILKENSDCFVGTFAIYTKVVDFGDWIQAVVRGKITED